MSNNTLETQVARLTAVEDIKQLKARYCLFCDNGYDPKGISGCFVEDGVWDGGSEFGRYEGKQAIHDFFKDATDIFQFAAHLVMNPIIEVNGDSASGKWRLIMPCTMNNDEGTPEAKWLLSDYNESYVQQNGQWFFKSLKVTNQFFADHASGWASQTS